MRSIPELTTAAAVDALVELAAGRDRVVVGLTGAPATGKSTVAATLAEACTARAVPTVVVPMDGFHLAQAVLDERGWAAVKGAPHTFDAAGYVALIARIRRERHGSVWAPAFDRSLEEPVAGSIEISPATRLVLTEGNYLLVDRPPWSQLPGLLNAVWYVETPDAVRQERLIARHRSYGRSLEEATGRALGTDERNALVIRDSRDRADAVLRTT